MANQQPGASLGRDAIRMLSTSGVVFLAAVTNTDAGIIGRHWNAVRRYLETGDSDDLEPFEQVRVTGRDDSGQARRVVLETDLDEIDRYAIRGDIRFESIYDEVQ
jgi:hypothetical protein